MDQIHRFRLGDFCFKSIYDFCDRLLDQKTVGSLVVVFFVRDLSTALTMALLVALFAFLVQWHIGRRIENLAKS